MNPRPFSKFLAAGLISASVFVTGVKAQTVTTDPVGAITITLKGSSDTNVSLPFHRPVALETQVSSISGNVISISASANITGNQFVYVANTQPNTYYLQFTTGSRAGMYYTVTANTPTSITVNPNGDTNLPFVVGTGDTFRVIPYWTLNTIFPNGQGINPSPGVTPGQRNSSVLLLPNNVPGINLVPGSSYYYYNGTGGAGPGWRTVSDNTFSIVNDSVLIYPDTYFVVRNSIPGDTTLTLVGAVPMAPYATPISTFGNNKPQDVFIGVNTPVTVTLAGSNLVQSGAFLPSSSAAGSQRNDQLLVFDSGTGLNRVPAQTYYYYNGTGGDGPGWRLASDNTFSIRDSDPIFQPGQAYVIRKKATANATTTIWTFTPSYLVPPP